MISRYSAGLVACCLAAACVATPTTSPIEAPEGPVAADQQAGPVGPVAVPPQEPFIPDTQFVLCAGFNVKNAPVSDRAGNIVPYAQLAVFEERIAIALKPVNGGCLSSGYGLRNGRLHEGIDISAPRGTWIYSPAPGIVREAGWANGYGNYVVLEHGLGLYTRFAHLDTFAEGLNVGSEYGFGVAIGQVGNSSTRRVGVHLHYEVLTGNIANPSGSFGLTSRDPFSLPPYVPLPES